MRTISISAIVSLGLAVQQAAATGWVDADTFKNPYNTNNQCVGKQSNGLGFDDHPNGDLGNYGSLNWQNAKCSNGLKKRTFGHSADSKSNDFAGGKCASGTASKDSKTSPQFACNADQKGMSINTIHVSSSEDTDLELEYGYDNGRPPCKQYASCSQKGTKIVNQQCGDAKSVTVKLPPNDKKSNCEVGIHSVDFHCGPSSKPPVPSSTPVSSTPVQSTPAQSTPVQSTPQESKPYPIPTVNTTTSAGPSAPQTTPQSTSISSTYTFTGFVPSPSLSVPANTSVPVYTSPTVETTPIISTTSNSPASPTTSAPGSTVPIVTTQVVYTTLTTCPVTNTVTSGSSTLIETTSTISTVFITSTSTVCTQCIPPVSTQATSSIPETSVIPPPETSVVPPPETSTTPESPGTTSSVPLSSTTANSPETPTSSVPAPIPTTTQAIVTTNIVYTTLTTCPVTNTVTSGTSTSIQILTTVSTITSTSTSTICTQCIPPPPATTSVSPPSSGVSPPAPPTTSVPSGSGNSPVVPPSSSAAPPAPAPPAPCPSVLPSCMKTWIQITACKDNSDSNCYCQDAEFTKTVQECVSAWAANNDDVQGALSYLAGICAPHVNQNPGIITNVPKTITLVPTPAAPSAASPPAGTSAANVPPVSPAPVASSVGNSPVGNSPAGNSPVGNSPVGNSPVGNAPVGTTGNSPAGATTAVPVPAAPVTTISVSVNCPVSQIADGQVQAPTSSSCVSVISVSVPQVAFSTAGAAAPGSSGTPNIILAAGSPAPVSATPTPTPGAGANSPIGATTLGTVPVGSTRPPNSTGSIPFTGSASNFKVTGFSVFLGLVAMLVFA
ncbi:MAG: hypothetical protein LQ350_004795 [Teloschistes chrysophthalmus]|nr:MAG: hypothetical protein LQ350_004795 [Niorma chrysophthalma]